MSNRSESAYWQIVHSTIAHYDIPATAFHMARMNNHPDTFWGLAMQVEVQALRRRLYGRT